MDKQVGRDAFCIDNELLDKFDILSHIILTEGLRDKSLLEKVSMEKMKEELHGFGIKLDFKDVYTFYLTLGNLREYATKIGEHHKRVDEGKVA